MKHSIPSFIAGLAAVIAFTGCSNSKEPQILESIPFVVGGKKIEVEVAKTREEWAIGLMNRNSMPQEHGMLFVFDQTSPLCFWMKDTNIPLSTAFLDEQGTIINVVDMEPLSEAKHCSLRPARFALEMNQGWFAKNGFSAGTKTGVDR